MDILAKFYILVFALNINMPSTATGILLRLPTKLYMVAVVLDKNHKDANEIRKPQIALAMAAI